MSQTVSSGGSLHDQAVNYMFADVGDGRMLSGEEVMQLRPEFKVLRFVPPREASAYL